MREPPEPIQPSAIAAVRRSAFGVADPHPDRRVRLLHRLWRHRLVCEMIEAALIGDFLLRPQRLDHVEFFAKPRDAAFLRYLELPVVVLAADADAEDRPAVADIVEAGPLVRDHQRAVDLQHDDRGAEADFRGHRRRIGQDDDRIEAEHMVERVLGDPQIAEPERLRPNCDLAHRRHVDRLRRAVRQRHAELDLVFESHIAASKRGHSGAGGAGTRNP